MKLKGFVDDNGICLSNKAIKGIRFGEVETILDLMFVTEMPYKFNEFKKLVSSCKEKKITLDIAGHKVKVNKIYLGRFLNSYTIKTAKEVSVSVLGSQSPVLFKINDDWLVLSPIIRVEDE
jgi:hypothetical protein